MTHQATYVLVFKTTIQTPADKRCVESILNHHPAILEWSVDMQDIDCVLRVVSPTLTPAGIISLINSQGFACAELD